MRLICVAAFLIFGCNSHQEPSSISIHVFAASSLTDALQELVTQFEQAYPDITIDLHVGPTSLLARQIVQGAPADVFLAASPVWMDYLLDHHLIQDTPIPFASNTLVIVGTHDRTSILSLSSLSMVKRLAMADPSHVPAGVYGKQALQCANVWKSVESRVIPTLDARAALTAVTSGSVDLALVYGSDLELSSDVKLMFEIPEACTPNITYMIGAVKGTQHIIQTESFVAFTADSLQQDIWSQFGFSH